MFLRGAPLVSSICHAVSPYPLQQSIYPHFPHRWYGVVMAKLPFRPYKLVQNISHRGLPGEDSTDASFVSFCDRTGQWGVGWVG